MKTKRFLSTLLALLLICSLPVSAFADTWYLDEGSITVNATESGQTVSQGTQIDVPDSAPVITQHDSSTSTSNNVIINADAGATANVTIQDVNINTSGFAITAEDAGNVTIELDGVNTVQSGHLEAGVRKRNGGNLTITDENETHGSLKATGGDLSAGIGGDSSLMSGNGSNITITGNAEVTAQGGYLGAGIGGGAGGPGSNITITGNAKVTATGGEGSAGIGGGYGSGGSNITVSENAQVKAQGGSGAIVNPNTNDLDEGWIATYASGTDMDTAAPNSLTYKDASGTVQTATENIEIEEAQSATCTEDGHQAGFSVDGALVALTIPHTGHSFTNYVSDDNATYTEDGTKTAKCDHCDATDTIPVPGSKLVWVEAAPLYQVINQDGKALACKAERQNGVLTITVEADFASLTGKLGGIQTLKAQGVDTIVFVTKGASSTFALSDLLSQGSTGDSYTLTHDGSTVTFTLGAGKTDVSDILAKP